MSENYSRDPEGRWGKDNVTVYGTGAVRSAEVARTRYDLVSPLGLAAVARAAAEGAERRGDFNWEKGIPATHMLNHALRHVYEFLGGDRSEDHLGHAAWNLLGAIHSMEVWPLLNEGTLRGPDCIAPGADGGENAD
jgi:hypothetical protein